MALEHRTGILREETYIENFALLELTLDHLNQGLVMVDPRAAQILIFNKRALEYSGVDQEQIQIARDRQRRISRYKWRAGEFGPGGSLMPEEVRNYFLKGIGTLNRSYIRAPAKRHRARSPHRAAAERRLCPNLYRHQ